jgi:hypothetical protein
VKFTGGYNEFSSRPTIAGDSGKAVHHSAVCNLSADIVHMLSMWTVQHPRSVSETQADFTAQSWEAMIEPSAMVGRLENFLQPPVNFTSGTRSTDDGLLLHVRVHYK